MSQKTNPISLRLQNSTKHFDSCWYSDFFYDQCLSDDNKSRVYIKGLLSQAGHTDTLPSMLSQYKRYSTLLFFLDQRAERHKREFALKLSREPTEHAPLPKIKFLLRKNKVRPLTWDAFVLIQAQDILSSKSHSQKCNYLVDRATTQKKAGFSYESIQEYSYKDCISGSFLNAFFLCGVVTQQSCVLVSPLKRDIAQNSRIIEIPDVKQRNGFPLINNYRSQALSMHAGSGSTSLFTNTKVGFINKFLPASVEGEKRETLFRGWILDQHIQSIENRMCYSLVRCLEKKVIGPNISSFLDIKQMKRLVFSCSVKRLIYKGLKRETVRFSAEQWQNKSLNLFHRTELLLNNFSSHLGYHTVYPIRALSPYQSANFLLESVAYLLQRKCSFRQIKDELFRGLEQDQSIKGARLSCAGRFGGRSKKAQKAKTQSAQWGETSLTVFSSRLSFASKGVSTTYGKVGVKLWICYKT